MLPAAPWGEVPWPCWSRSVRRRASGRCIQAEQAENARPGADSWTTGQAIWLATARYRRPDPSVDAPRSQCLRPESQPTLWGHASRVPGRGWRGVAPLPLRTPSFPRRCRGSGRAAGAAPRNPPPVRRWLTHRTAMVAARATSSELASGRAKAVAIDSRMIEMAAILLFAGIGTKSANL